MEFTLPNNPELPPVSSERLAEFGKSHALAPKVMFALDHALNEHLQNVVDHSGARTASLRLQIRDGAVHVTVFDDGDDFDPLTASEPDLVGDPDARPIGGLGVHMMRKLTDSLAYRRTPAGNELEFVKRLA